MKRDFSLTIFIGGMFFGAAIIGLVALAFIPSPKSSQNWAAFATQHHCIVISRRFDHTGEIGYYCDDGVVYYR